MKHIAAAMILLLTTATSYQQVPNGNFEEWGVSDSTEFPSQWVINSEFCCLNVEKVADAIEGAFSLKLFIHPANGSIPSWLAETTIHAEQFYQALSAAVRIDSMYLGRVVIKVLELENGFYQEIGSWETTEVTDGVEQLLIPLNQTQTDSLKIQLNAMVLNATQLPIGYAELIIDEIELSLGSSTEKQHKQDGTFRIYPNPTNGMVNMDFPKGQALKIVRIYNSEAKLLKVSENMDSIDLTGLPGGAYLLNIQTDDGTIVTRLIQKK